MTASAQYSSVPRLKVAELAKLRNELEQDLRRLTIAGFSEGGTWFLDARAQVRARKTLSALARMEDGTYGSGRGCGEPIPDARLIALPEATACFHCTAGLQ